MVLWMANTVRNCWKQVHKLLLMCFVVSSIYMYMVIVNVKKSKQRETRGKTNYFANYSP